MEEIGDGSMVEKESEKVKFYPFKKIVAEDKKGLNRRCKDRSHSFKAIFKLNLL
jgi:hypothetical protein